MNIVIIEDEKHIAERLEELLTELLPEVVIHQRIRSIREGLAYFKKQPTLDLIFSDIELLDGQSFEIFHQAPQTTPIVFCTAFDEFALKAFEVNGIDYILKPFSKERLAHTLEKHKQLTTQQARAEQPAISDLLKLIQSHKSSRVLVHKGEKTIPIRYEDIALIHLQNGVTYLYTFDEQRYHVNQRLETLEQALGTDFYRLNRQVLIHRDAVSYTITYFARKLKVTASIPFDGELIVSKAGTAAFLAWLEG